MMIWRFLWRELKAGELNLLFSAIAVAVTIIVSIGLFTERMKKSLVAETSAFLAADMVLQSADPVSVDWLRADDALGLSQATTVQFASMASAGDEMYLASVKAVAEGYPLLGALEISREPYGPSEKISGRPQAGEAWLDSRLMGLLKIQLGDLIWIGDKSFTAAHILAREPDASSSYWSLGPRVMIRQEDLASTGVIQPGSRVEYRYLFAGSPGLLKNYRAWLEPRLGKQHRLLTLEDSQPALAQSLRRAQSFLLLAGSLGVLLASVAIAMAARRYSLRHLDAIALLKVLGASMPTLRSIVWLPLLPMTMVAILCGYGAGLLIEQFFLWIMREWLPPVLPGAGWKPYLLGGLTGCLCVFLFAVPVLAQLLQVSPLRILRRELSSELHSQKWLYFSGITVLYVLMIVFSGDVRLVSWIFLGVILLCLVTAGAALMMMAVIRVWGSEAVSVWRLALAHIRRNQAHSALQLVMFSLILMLLITSVLIRSSLVDEWQKQLPAGTPNQFLINIFPHEVNQVSEYLEQSQLSHAGFYPMVRGRIVLINGMDATQVAREQVDELYRELNLTWSGQLPEDNRIVDGQWWQSNELSSQHRVSIEAGLAHRLNIRVGDLLVFSIGDAKIKVYVASIRELSWDRMRPNFYFIFEPGSLEGFPATYITSFYLPEGRKPFLNELLRQFPTLSIFSIDEMISRIQEMVNQVTRAIEIVLWLILLAGVLVMVSILQASVDERLRVSALLRSMGASRGLILGSLAIEFSVLGLCAGLLAAMGSSFVTWLLQSQLLHLSYAPSFWPWAVGPCAGIGIVCIAGLLACVKVVRVPPLSILQGALC